MGIVTIFIAIDPSHKILINSKQGKTYLTFQHQENHNDFHSSYKEDNPDHQIQLSEYENLELNYEALNPYESDPSILKEISIAFSYISDRAIYF